MFHPALRAIRAPLLIILALVVAWPFATPARAEILECDEVWVEVAQKIRAERHEGLTAERLDELNHLIDLMVACAENASHSGDPALTGVDRWGSLVAAYFDPEDVARALCLMGHESAGDPDAKNPTSGAAGLMQVMPFWAGRFGLSTADLFDPATNLEVASWIRDSQGWTAWSPYQRGLCH